MSQEPGQGGKSGLDTPEATGSEPSTPGGGPEPAAQPPSADRDGAAQSGRRALWLGITAFLLTLLTMIPISLALGIAAVVFGIRALRRAHRAGIAAPGAVIGMVLGAIAVVISTIFLVVTIIIWPELSDYRDCLVGANTETDKQVCQDEHFPAIEKKLGLDPGALDDSWLDL